MTTPPSRLPSTRLRLAVLLVVAALLPWLPAGAATQDELQATRDRIDQTMAELRSVDAEAEQTAEQVATAEARVEELEAALNELLEQLEAQERRVDAAREEAETAAAERDRIADLLGERARRAYMGGTPDPLMMLGGQGMDDVAGALDNLAVLDALSARANASIETLDVARVRADATAERLDQAVEELEQVRAAREEVLVEAEELLSQREGALAQLEAESDRLMAQREDLEAEEAEIQQLIEQQAAEAKRREEERRAAEQAAREAAESAQDTAQSTQSTQSTQATSAAPAPSSAPPPSSSGCYAWPANGAVTSEYGPRWGRMHAGLDIDGDTGDPLYAAQSGTVTYTGYHSGYGNLTLIRHSDGVTTAYAHQTSFGVVSGQNVSRGEYIGTMGTTGNVTGSHLHFETRTSSGAVNPRNYLC